MNPNDSDDAVLRRMRGRLGALTAHSRHTADEMVGAATEEAERKLNERLLAEVDPAGDLPPEERERRLRHARSAHFTRLSLLGVEARRAKTAEREGVS